ncbi:hypothetical protein MMC10_009920 [Thelotrema lepadinum]|nr:hypothetical protein [Thelotrema lepadinum]
MHSLSYPNLTLGSVASSAASTQTQLRIVDTNHTAILGINGTGNGNWTLQGIPLSNLSASCPPTPYNFSSLDLVAAVPGFFITTSFNDSSMSVWRVIYATSGDCYTLQWAAKFGYMAPQPVTLAANMIQDPNIPGDPFPRALWPEENGWLNSTDFYGNASFSGFSTISSGFSNGSISSSADYRDISPFVAFADMGSNSIAVYSSTKKGPASLYATGGTRLLNSPISLAWL